MVDKKLHFKGKVFTIVVAKLKDKSKASQAMEFVI